VKINLDEEGILINLDEKLSTKGDTIPRKKNILDQWSRCMMLGRKRSIDVFQWP
jgi:hypothetical protein